MYLFIIFGKSTPQRNRQLNIVIRNSKQQVDDFVGQLFLKKQLKDALCGISLQQVHLGAQRRWRVESRESFNVNDFEALFILSH